MNSHHIRQGVLCALGAYFIWGIAPAYFKLIQQVPAGEIMTHRVIWSFIFMILLISISRHWTQIASVLRQPKKVLALAVSATFVCANWLIFIWAVNNHHILQASLGYFITPLFNVVAGMVFLRERFRRLQWLAVALAACGVLVQLWMFGSLPVIGLGLAITFTMYGLLRKKIAVDALSGMLIETGWLLIPAALYLFVFTDSPTSHLANNPLQLNLLLVAAGVVTTVPLLLFTAACARLRLSTLGFFQYLGPTLIDRKSVV